MIQRDQTGPMLEAFFLLVNYHSHSNCCEVGLEKKRHQWSSPAPIPYNYNTNLADNICQLVNVGKKYFGSNQLTPCLGLYLSSIVQEDTYACLS